MKFQLGHAPFNKNKKLTEEHRKNISKSMIGKINSIKGKTKINGLYPKNCGFKKGHTPYGGAIKGRLKGQIPHNANTSIWIECKCQNSLCSKIFKVRKYQFERRGGKYCSKECFIESLKNKIPYNKLPREIRTCICGCSRSFECPINSTKKFYSKKCVNTFRLGKKIKPFTDEHKRKIGEANKLVPHPRGKNHPCWKNGLTSFYMVLRNLDEYKKWRMQCLERDWFRCQECFSKEKLEVHHTISFKLLVNDFLRQYSQFSPIDDRETLTRLAISYTPFWDINLGKTLCEKCHKHLNRSII
jgi:hypothetical protein